MKRKRQKRDGAANQEPVTVASPDTDVENFGPWLKQQREVREIDRREVADASKISVRYIEALETNRFEVLPAGVFTKGFLRQYAVYVGLDPEEVVNYYLAALQAQQDQQEPDPDLQPRPRSSSSANAKWLLAAILIGAVLISVVWLLFRMSAAGELGAGGSADEPQSAPVPAAGDRSAATTGSRGPTADRVASETTDAGPVVPRPADSRASTTLAKPEVDDQLEAPVDSPPSAVNTALDPVDEPAEATAPLTVVVDFSGDCWVEATLDEGRRLAEMRVQGESMRLEADSTIDVKFGDARVVTVQVNGMPYVVETNRGSSVVDVRFDLQTVASLKASNR